MNDRKIDFPSLYMKATYDCAQLKVQCDDLSEKISCLRDENETLREAFGLISTISPHMEVDVNDYIGMAQKIYAENKKLNEELNCWHEAANWPEKSPQTLRAENEKLRAAFRVNMLRAFPSMSHDEIDAEIEAAIRESGE
jgi:hypothetical protein